jgi:hypothetical protein
VKDVYVKVKDASGNVSEALKISVPAYEPGQSTAPSPSPVAPGDTPNFDDIVITGGTVVYLNPAFSTVVIKFGNY